MKTEELRELIIELNEFLFEIKLWDKGWRFSYQDTFYEQLVLLNEEVIWSSEDESRKWIKIENEEGDIIEERYETWKSFILRIISEKIDNFINLFNEINGKMENH